MHPQIYVCGDWNPQWARECLKSGQGEAGVCWDTQLSLSVSPVTLTPPVGLPHWTLTSALNTPPVLPFHLEADSVLMSV